MEYIVKTDRPGRMRITFRDGILEARDVSRLAQQLSEVPGVARVTPYMRLGEVGISYRSARENTSRKEILRSIASFAPRYPLRPRCRKPEPHLIKDPLLRFVADTAIGAIVPAPVRIAGKLLDTGYRAHLQ